MSRQQNGIFRREQLRESASLPLLCDEVGQLKTHHYRSPPLSQHGLRMLS